MCYVFLTINWSEAVKGTKCSSPLEKKKNSPLGNLHSTCVYVLFQCHEN